MSHGTEDAGGARRLKTVSWWVFAAFAAIAAYFLLKEHRAHLYGNLPYLLLAACPLLHFFHHGGHGRKAGDHGASTSESRHHR